MTEQTTETSAEPDGEGERIQSLTALSDKVDRLAGMVEKLVGGGQRETPAEPAAEADGDTRAQTRQAAAEIARRKAAREARAARDAESEARLKAVEDKVREKPPAEYRRVTRFMRWEDKKDDE